MHFHLHTHWRVIFPMFYELWDVSQDRRHVICRNHHLFRTLLSKLGYRLLFNILTIQLLFHVVITWYHLRIFYSLWIFLTYKGNYWRHYLLRCNAFFREFKIEKIRLCLHESLDVTINLPLTIAIIVKTLMEGWSYSTLIKPWEYKQ